MIKGTIFYLLLQTTWLQTETRETGSQRQKGTKLIIKLIILSSPKNELSCLNGLDIDSSMWHKRLGHVSFSLLNKLITKDVVLGLSKLKFREDKICDACIKGKQVRSSFKSKKVVSTYCPLELLHMDLCGPMRVQSRGEKKYIYL